MLKNDKMHKNNILNNYALPTGALDSRSSSQVMELFGRLNAEGVTILMITHDRNIAECARRMVTIFDGELSEEKQ